MSQDNDNGDVKISMAKANRKIAKPIMEKKRRARINASLNELKTLLVEVLQKEGCRHSSKMEKADILEMAVRHLKNLQKQQNFPGSHTPSLRDSYPPAIPVEKYASSFSPDCLSPELKRFFVRSPTDTKSATDPTSPDSTVTSQPMVKLDCNRNIVAAPLPINTNSNMLPINTTISGMSTAALPGNSNTITQPMMTRTATGEIAVVLPQHLLKQAAASQSNAGGLILPIYTLPQNATQLGVDTKVPISPLGSPQQQPVMISINMPTLQQSQCSAFTSLPSSSSTTSSSQSSLQSPISPVWRPW